MIRELLVGGASWNDEPSDRARAYPCDELGIEPVEALFRAVDVDAPAATVYRWLCQLTVAPYSYDLVDNFGRQSPREVTPGSERLQVGQPVMTIFRLESFTPGLQLTMRMHRRRAVLLFGDLALTYALQPMGDRQCRLVVKILLAAPPGHIAGLRRRLLACGDLVMMRKQLLTLRSLAEGSGPVEPAGLDAGLEA